MTDNHLKAETQKTSRRYELELLKALAIISMIICHPVIRLGIHNPGYEKEFLFFLGQDIFGNYLCVAHAFMFAMGFGIVFTRKNTPKELMLRGVKIYLLGYVLNFFRYGIFNLTEAIFTGEFRSDMLAIAGVLSVIGSVIPAIDTGNFAGNWLLGHFVYTDPEACTFVFFNWYIFVAIGMVFGSILRKTEDTDRLYKRLLIVSCCVMVVYITLTFIFGVYFLCRDHNYYMLSLPEAAGLLSIDLSFLSAFYFLLKRVPASKLRVFLDMSRNITPIYFIHWIILGFVDSIFCYLLDITFPWPVIYLIGVVLSILSSWIANLWAGRKRRAKAK